MDGAGNVCTDIAMLQNRLVEVIVVEDGAITIAAATLANAARVRVTEAGDPECLIVISLF